MKLWDINVALEEINSSMSKTCRIIKSTLCRVEQGTNPTSGCAEMLTFLKWCNRSTRCYIRLREKGGLYQEQNVDQYRVFTSQGSSIAFFQNNDVIVNLTKLLIWQRPYFNAKIITVFLYSIYVGKVLLHSQKPCVIRSDKLLELYCGGTILWKATVFSGV